MSSPRILLDGFTSFDNRGVEALLRGTVSLIRDEFGDAEFVVPTRLPEQAGRLWSGEADPHMHFVDSHFSFAARAWIHAQRAPLPAVQRMTLPLPVSRRLRNELRWADALVAMRGDDYSLDYRIPSSIMRVDRAAMRFGTPTMLWAVSVGPFERAPAIVPTMRSHMAQFDAISVRETVSLEYLDTWGIRARLVADAAFRMEPEFTDVARFWPDSGDAGVIGLNISPLAAGLAGEARSREYPAQVARFIRHVVVEHGFGVLLIPHVVPTGARTKNSDATYLASVSALLPGFGRQVTMMPSTLNAAQTKYVVSRCRFFVGARTHSTIAALGSGVPAISVSYSRKSVGINRDVYGHERYLIRTAEADAAELTRRLEMLLQDEGRIRPMLGDQQAALRASARVSSSMLRELLENRVPR